LSAPVHALSTGGELTGVSCVAASYCVAVGDALSPASAPPGTALAELWNGVGWSVHSPALVPKSIASPLTGVACTSTKSCFAVGYYQTAANQNGIAMIERWNGAGWTFVSPPLPSGTAYSVLSGVSCSTANYCVAVGYWYKTTSSPSQPLAELWNGSVWKVDAEPVVPNNEFRQLNAISCVGTSFCTAAGTEYQALPDLTLAQSGNGTTWLTQKTTNTSKQVGNYLEGVRCATTKFCIAVGWSNTSLLMEQWNGSAWNTILAPKPAGETYSVLSSVSCSMTFCKAVGNADAPSSTHTLAESYSNSRWTINSSANVASANNELSGVSCATATACMAVGHYTSGTNYVTLAERLSGSSWVITPS
jgi:hypothetical protein